MDKYLRLLLKQVATSNANVKKVLYEFLPVAQQKLYEIRLKFFLNRRNAWVKTAGYFLDHKLIYLTAIYTIAVAYVTWLSGHYLVPRQDATTFFTAAGAMVGAALAIILTFNTLIINFAGTEFPPEFYQATGYDWRQNVIYFLLAADATGLFVFSLVFHARPHYQALWLFPLSIFLICFAFYLLFASYLVTRKRLDPASGLLIIRNIAIKHLVKGAKAGDRLAKVFATSPNLKPEDKGIARREAYTLMAPILEQVGKINGYLHDYHDKLLARQNYATASRVLDTIYAILMKYIEIRRDNMQARVSTRFLSFTSDSQSFFEDNLQQLVDKAKRYMEAKNSTGAIHISDLMGNLALEANTVDFGMPTRNPLLDRILGYINFLNEEAIAKKDIEVLFHLADVYSILGRHMVEKDMPLARSSIYDQLVRIGQAGALAKQTSIMGRVADAFTAILKALYNQDSLHPDREPKRIIDEYQKVLMLYCVSVSDSQSAITIPQMLQPYNTLLSWIAELSQAPAEQVNRRTRSLFIELAEVMRDSMRHMSGVISLGDHIISVEMGIIIQNATDIMLTLRSQESWRPADSELMGQARWYIHQLTWFTEKTTNASEYITGELVENAGHVGLRALETDTPEIAIDSVNVISQLAHYYMDKARRDNGYEPARFMQVACLVGIYAKKLGMDEIYEITKTKAVAFNSEFNRRHFPDGPLHTPDGRDYLGLHPDQLIRELNQLYQETDPEYGVIPAYLDTLEEKFGQYIDREDVEAFISEVTELIELADQSDANSDNSGR